MLIQKLLICSILWHIKLDVIKFVLSGETMDIEKYIEDTEKYSDEEIQAIMQIVADEIFEEYGRQLESEYEDIPDISPSHEALEKFIKSVDEYYKE